MIHLNELLGNKAALALLHQFSRHPAAEISFTQVRKVTKLSPATVAKGVKMLEKNGLITHRPLGNMKLYRVEREHAFVKHLKILQTIIELMPLQDIAKRFGCSIYLFGSRARGENTEQSDTDLLIIAEDQEKEIQTALELARRKMDIPLPLFSIHLFTGLEWADMARKDPAFYERVEKDKVQIV